MLRWIIAFFLVTGLFTHPLFAKNSSPQPERELSRIEQDISALKEDILRQKVQLRQIEEDVLFGEISQTRAAIVFRDSAQQFFQLVEAQFELNGRSIAKVSTKDMKGQKNRPILVFDGEIPPGEHILKLFARYHLKGKGPFTYTDEYKYTVDSQKTFSVTQGTSRALEILIHDRGYFKSDLKNRLAVKFQFSSGS